MNMVIEKIYNDFVDSIFRFFYIRTENRDLALDLTSKTFEKVLKNLNKYDASKGKVSTWIFTIARNVFIDYLRKNGAIDLVDISSMEGTLVVNKRNKDLDNYVYKDMKRLQLLEAISQLNPLEQQLVHLRYTEGLSYKEIATQVGLNVNTVGIKLHRIIKKLKLFVKQTDDEG